MLRKWSTIAFNATSERLHYVCIGIGSWSRSFILLAIQPEGLFLGCSRILGQRVFRDARVVLRDVS